MGTRGHGSDGEESLQERLGYTFSDQALLERALTHRSSAYEQRGGDGQDYERLEFLGDAVLGFVVSDWLCKDDPEAPEGVLTRRKQSVVRTQALALAARRVGLGRALRLGRGEESTGGREKLSLLADAFEAIVGAIYLDGGIRASRAFVRRHLAISLRAVRGDLHTADDFKTRLQEEVQATMHLTPRYRIVAMHGPAHARRFEVEVLLGAEAMGRGAGASRKQAEQEAARAALARVAGRERDEA